MAKLLYLVHRLPFPPDKGDKVRSYHLLRHLLASHEVHLGTFVDDPADEVHVETLRAMCADLHVARLSPRAAKLRSLRGLLTGEALSLPYYRDAGLAGWVRATLAANDIRAAVVFSSPMAQYVPPGVESLVDFVDLDSAKWTQYAESRRFPMSWLYRREGRRLLAAERDIARRARRSFFVTEAEAALFLRQAPEAAGRVEAMNNGVDARFFAPDPQRASPFAAGEIPLVFTGAMDYWPNADAVQWFVAEALPALRRDWPALRLHVVGRNPTPEVAALAGDAVAVTGTVPDVRPYLQHAAVVVAPLRLARGIQNKVLEAMAMARPVVASAGCAEAIDARAGVELAAAAQAADFVARIGELLRTPRAAEAMGQAARACVEQRYGWSAHLAKIDRHLPAGDRVTEPA